MLCSTSHLWTACRVVNCCSQQCLMPTAWQVLDETEALSLAAELQESLENPGQHADIWSDQPVLQLIRNGPTQALRQDADYPRCCRRARSYYVRGDQILRRMKDGK